MADHQVSKIDFIEEIGVYSNSLVHSPGLKHEGDPYRFHFHQNLQTLHCWILASRPRLVIFEPRLLEKTDPTELKSLRETLNKWGILSLFLTRSVDEIRAWRDSGWPRIHFLQNGDDEKHLRQKINQMLQERLLFERPRVAVLTGEVYLSAQLESLLRKYGIHMIPVSETDVEPVFDFLACEHPDALLWDVNAFMEQGPTLYQKIQKTPSMSTIPIFFVSGSKNRPTNPLWKILEGDLPLYTSDKLSELILQIRESLDQKRQIKLAACRDVRTGLFVLDTFLDLAEREMALANRRGDEFSVLKIRMPRIPEMEHKYGSIFAGELEMTLGLFIQHRVRSSDFVAQGARRGEVAVLLPNVDRQTAHLVGERLCRSFAKEASFRDGTVHRFSPKLEYEAYSYPYDVKSKEALEKALCETVMPALAPARRPLRVNLAEE